MKLLCFRNGLKKLFSCVLLVILIVAQLPIEATAAEASVMAFMIRDASILQNGDIQQRFQLSGSITVDDYNTIREVGIVYSSTDITPQIGEAEVQQNTAQLSFVNQIFAQTAGLTESTTYYASLYTVFHGGETIYSNVLSYLTPITVAPGQQIGCSNLVSGGYYSIHNGTTINPSSHIAIIDSSYTAEYNNFPYSTGDQMIKSGMNSLITTDNVSGLRYLHVFNLAFEERPLSLSNGTLSDATTPGSSGFTASFTYTSNDENILQEGGILYSEENPSLEFGAPGVTRVPSLSAVSGGSFSLTATNLPTANATYFIRGYLLADGTYYYSNILHQFHVTNLGDAGAFLSPLSINSFFEIGSYSQTVANNCTAKLDNQIYTAGEQLNITTLGNHYILNTWSNLSQSITFVPLDNSPPVYSNLKDNDVFNSAITPLCNEYNAIFYISKDGEPEREFANGIKISESGYYYLKVLDSVSNISEYHFQITSPSVITEDCMSVTVNSAELSATFVNNGSVLERGFIYSMLNNTPVVDGIGCLTYLPTEDPNPGFLTSTLTGLAINSRYFFRGYIKTGTLENPVYTYGAIKEFTTENANVPTTLISYPTEVTASQMTLHGIITQDGGSTILERGFLYSTQPNPSAGNPDTITVVSSTNGIGSYQLTIDSLQPNTNYYVKAYAKNGIGTSISAVDQIVKTMSVVEYTASINLPTVSMNAITDISKTAAHATGVISSNGNGSIRECGFVLSSVPNPRKSGIGVRTLATSLEGTISTNLNQLTPGETYYVAFYATNEAGTAYSNAVTFTTIPNINILSVKQIPSEPTNKEVILKVSFPDVAMIKQYKINAGNYQLYSAPIILQENGIVTLRYADDKNRWSEEMVVTVDNIDKVIPTKPKLSYYRPSNRDTSLLLTITNGVDSKSGVDYSEYTLGTGDEWIKYTSPVILPANVSITAHTVDKAGNPSKEVSDKKSIKIIELLSDNNTTTYHYVDTSQKATSDGIAQTISLKGDYFPDDDQYGSYVTYPTGQSYKGCGINAAQIFIEWFGYSWSQSHVHDYVETTDFGRFIDFDILSNTWADPSIFTTPAQLDSGIQAILNLKYSGYTIVRSSPGTKASAIAMIESYLSHGYPVIMLVNDGGHWQVITECTITRDSEGKIIDTEFLVHDNGGSEYRTWGELDYFFEDNYSAELARELDYTSYVDTIMSVLYEEPVYKNNWTGGWTQTKMFEVDHTNYLFRLKEGSGLVHINKVNEDGSIGSLVADYNWSSGWNSVSFFQKDGFTYLLLAKSSNNLFHIRKMNSDGSIGDLVDDRTFTLADFSVYDLNGITIEGKPYVLARLLQNGGGFSRITIYSIEADGTLGTKTGGKMTPSVTATWTNTEFYSVNGKYYLLLSDAFNGHIKIYGVDNNGFISDSITSYIWSEGWTNMKTFTRNGKTYLLTAKSDIGPFIGTMFSPLNDPDGIVRIHEINADGTIGSLVDDAYWQTGIDPYSQLEFFLNPSNNLFLFAYKVSNGITKILQINEDGTIKTNLK